MILPQCSQAEPRVADAAGADADHGAPALQRSSGSNSPQLHHPVLTNGGGFRI